MSKTSQCLSPEEVADEAAGGGGVDDLEQQVGVGLPGQGLVPQQHGHQVLIAVARREQRLPACSGWSPVGDSAQGVGQSECCMLPLCVAATRAGMCSATLPRGDALAVAGRCEVLMAVLRVLPQR